jgi:DNA-binding response OmpR family regulator
MRKIKLLYAEDEQKTRELHISYIQSRYDFIIYEACDGEEALAIYKEWSPDIVLTDISMPKMTGLELSKEIRKISKDTKIIIVTAHSEKEKLLQAISMNMIDYIVKPIKRQQLKDSLDTAIKTLHSNLLVNSQHIFLDKNCYYDLEIEEYFVDKNIVSLSNSEKKLLTLLCKNLNRQFNSFDIFVHIWEDEGKKYSSTSIRTLIKNLRQKIPKDKLINIYGGLYKLQVNSSDK